MMFDFSRKSVSMALLLFFPMVVHLAIYDEEEDQRLTLPLYNRFPHSLKYALNSKPDPQLMNLREYREYMMNAYPMRFNIGRPKRIHDFKRSYYSDEDPTAPQSDSFDYAKRIHDFKRATKRFICNGFRGCA